MKTIYLDNASTTRVSDEVVKAMMPYFSDKYGNPSSTHTFGEEARRAIDDSRKLIANEINAKPGEIVFTSGATESNNIIIQGVSKLKGKGKIIISSIEHSSVYETCKALKKWGYIIAEIPVDKNGILDINRLEEEIDKNTILVSIMHVNNEIGTINDISMIGKICRDKGVLFHCDCAQSFGKLKIDVRNMNIDFLSGSAHKIGGPKGIGFLYYREGVKIEPIFYGGGQEKGLRSGTENVPGIIGLSKALEMSKKTDKNKIKKLRDKLFVELGKIGAKINGDLNHRLYNNVHFSLNLNADSLVSYLSENGIMCSTKSACLDKNDESRVLKNIGLNKKEINGSVRIVVNEDNSEKDIEVLINSIKEYIDKFK